MRIIKTYKLFTENHYTGTYWTDTIDGEKFTITIQDVEEYLKNEPVVEIPVSKVKELSIHKTKTDEVTLKRVSTADLNFPIIITKDLDGKYGMILDGHHRLQKAVNSDQEVIKAKILDLKTAPEEWKYVFR